MIMSIEEKFSPFTIVFETPGELRELLDILDFVVSEEIGETSQNAYNLRAMIQEEYL